MPRPLLSVGITAILLLGSALLSLGQAVLTGFVTDAANGQPMPFANVYINGSTQGAVTDEKGFYRLTGLPLGTVEIAASFVGYQSALQKIRFENAAAQKANFALKASEQMLDAVTVRGNPKSWERNLRQFKKQLFGEPFGGQCELVNSEVLNFKEDKDHLYATAQEPLIVDNQALGYRLIYALQHFDAAASGKIYFAGTARFEELKPENERQAERFRRNRLTAYKGSTRHLMASLIDNTFEQAGFLVYQEDITKSISSELRAVTLSAAVSDFKRLVPVHAAALIQPGKLPNERKLVSTRKLVVFYTKATSNFSPYPDARYAYTEMRLPAGNLQMTVDGVVTMPNGMEAVGSMGDDRLSTMLPAEWKPEGNSNELLPNAPLATRGKLAAPDTLLTRIASAFDARFRLLAPTVFVHIDKPVYVTGDRIWMSTFLLDAASHQRLAGETALHVDLLTPNGKVVQHQWVRITDGRGQGNLRLSDTLATGTYRLRAYTDEDDAQRRPAFERVVAVFNLVRNNLPPSSDTVAQQQLPLLRPGSEELSLSADMLSDSSRLTLTIMSAKRAATDSAYILVQQRGRVADQRKVILQNGVAKVSLPVTTWLPGLTQVILYDALARPQAERLVFVPESSAPVQVVLKANKTTYQPREEVVLSVNLNDNGSPASGALSASVTDVGKVPEDSSEATFQAHLLLTGELRGRVENPGQYFTNRSAETRRALDNLLLTQGWRRVSGTPAADSLGGISLSGRMLDAKRQPIPGGQITIVSTAPGQSFVKTAAANEQGYFRLSGMNIADTIQLMTQLADHRSKRFSVKEAAWVQEGPGRLWEAGKMTAAPDWQNLQSQLEAARSRQEANADFYRDKTAKELNEVTVRGQKEEDRPDDIKMRSLHNEADAVVTFNEKSPAYANLYEMLQGRFAGVTVTRSVPSPNGPPKPPGYMVFIRGQNSYKSGTQPLYIMDGVPVQDPDGNALMNFNPRDIERIEVLKNAGTKGIDGMVGGNGVIAFYTKRARFMQVNANFREVIRPVQFIGYPSVQREFYVPRYDSEANASGNAGAVDDRDVIYWKPLIQTDNQGRTQLRFPLSDVVRTIRVTIQGITAEGRPVYTTQLIRVQ